MNAPDLLKQICDHMRCFPPHVKERKTYRLLDAAYKVLLNLKAQGRLQASDLPEKEIS